MPKSDPPQTSWPSTQISKATSEEIAEDINGSIHGPVGELVPKYFSKFNYLLGGDVAQSVARISGPTAPTPEQFLQWFTAVSSLELDGTRGKWHTSSHTASESEDARGSHISLTLSAGSSINTDEIWGDAQVIGQFCQGDSISYQDGLLDLCGHAREVFASQPTRLFLHGFYIRGSLMELWVFDRSGIYSSDLLDMHDDFPWFLAVLLSYRLMSDSELGRSDVIQDCEAGRCITIKDAAGMPLGRSGKLYLEDRAIALASELVGEGLACYRAKSSPSSSRWEYVVKFKWRLARDRPEEEMLKWVNEKNAWGVISLDHHRKIETTANLRRGIRWGPCRRLLTGDEHQHLLPSTRKHRGIHGLTEATDETFGNRIFTCVVVSPAGRPLGTFKTILELLEVLRDAVKAHRSVLQDAGVLHQDVSPGNIIITDTQDHREPKGILIDFDVAMRLDVGPRTPGEVTGTRLFMAIGILKCRRHTYRHDLESFLYVFLWTLLANGNENPPRTSKLRLWSRGTWDESADAKVAQMDRDGFQSILTEFPPEVHSLRSLAEKLRRLLFPLEDGALWTGTDSSLEGTNALYDGIIGAFDDAIAILGTTHLEAS